MKTGTKVKVTAGRYIGCVGIIASVTEAVSEINVAFENGRCIRIAVDDAEPV